MSEPPYEQPNQPSYNSNSGQPQPPPNYVYPPPLEGGNYPPPAQSPYTAPTQPFNYPPQGQPNPPKKSSNLPLIIGGISAVVLIGVVIALVVILTGSNSTNKATPTAIGAIQNTVAPVATATVALATATRSLPRNTAAVTSAPNLNGGGAYPLYPNTKSITVPASIAAQFSGAVGINNAKLEAFSSADSVDQIKSNLASQLIKSGWQDASNLLGDFSSVTSQLEAFGAFLIAYEKNGQGVAYIGVPGIIANSLGFSGLSSDDNVLLIVSGNL